MASFNTIKPPVTLEDEMKCTFSEEFEKKHIEEKLDPQTYQTELRKHVTRRLYEWYQEVEEIKQTLADRFLEENRELKKENPQEYQEALCQHIQRRLDNWYLVRRHPLEEVEKQTKKQEKPGQGSVLKRLSNL